ncbi:hypothetical protein CR194_16925 [Salipaludibacillus keqinensis]|uniref:Uncharacterized protein n=1 Tax=Salipaludibacillus keqinensis TaxID=2045207 RepID=A0A323T730_9BACI|nr:hypothetical protein [Salipaludibacillus keqinensis]PYZ91892.1 hypothetical protein CR194_16925 [Salipaludibacillus keqinensis]
MGIRANGCDCAAWDEILEIDDQYNVTTEAGTADAINNAFYRGTNGNFLIFDPTGKGLGLIYFCCTKITSIQEAPGPN